MLSIACEWLFWVQIWWVCFGLSEKVKLSGIKNKSMMNNQIEKYSP